ncbi:MAG: (Fe-S)-binding protein [Sporocytophaga sp.]|uniref:(Fe-S)-binding protein n=1 Tax=Sporocytophaga sp. TaxID=2231183 RepID=UPI001B0ACED3|nr:(Fe-S)-binding protein [Sporocytophaga sp.]MBO9701587.1 (Fe-S)-binding protein [Sporocytophaga sp.]
MEFLPQVIFLLLLSASGFFITKSILRIRRNILLGRDLNRYDKPGERLKMMVLVALGQKKMFKRPLPAILHLFVYVGFIIINIEVLEIIIDGLFGTHRIFAPIFRGLYPSLINIFEFLAISVLVSCAIFLVRRNIIKVKRFDGEEMKRWPKLDANIILSIEIFLMICFLSMNTSDGILQTRGSEHYIATGDFFFTSFLKPLFNGLDNSELIFIERFGWWAHIIGILAFAMYVFTDSKHLHIFIAFPNTYFSKLDPAGRLSNMPEVTKEVKLMLNLPVETGNDNAAPGRFGAKDVQDLTWKNLMEAYSCTECGRCTSQCPANLTGKKLSPRKIMMDTRDRLEEVGRNIEANGKDHQDGKSLLGDYITVEEIMACTTCNACVEACPVNIDPVSIIVQLRRFKIMEESQAPASWNGMFSNIENNFAPWKFSPSDRLNWVQKLNQ